MILLYFFINFFLYIVVAGFFYQIHQNRKKLTEPNLLYKIITIEKYISRKSKTNFYSVSNATILNTHVVRAYSICRLTIVTTVPILFGHNVAVGCAIRDAAFIERNQCLLIDGTCCECTRNTTNR